MTWGLEGALGAAFFFFGGIGVCAELVGDVIWGAGTPDVSTVTYPILSGPSPAVGAMQRRPRSTTTERRVLTGAPRTNGGSRAVGGCGRAPTALDPIAYGDARKAADCSRCQECSLTTARCGRACDPNVAPETLVPAICHPLEHDGEVCLRARAAASCDAFARYLTDVAPETPTECGFCERDGG